ncbi:MAG TPA: hypothetical protein VIY72_04155 [Acidimicrobiales bacterium]
MALSIRSGDAARRRLDQGIDVLGRLVPLARRISRLVGGYVIAVGVASVVIVVTLVVRFWPGSLLEVFAHLVLAAMLLAPVAMLWLFHRALSEAVRIPARLVAMPDVAKEHGGELAGLVRDAQVRRGRLRLMTVPADLWRAGRLLLAAHDDLPGYGAVLTLVSVPFLLASLAAACVGLGMIVLAPAVVTGAVLTTVF